MLDLLLAGSFLILGICVGSFSGVLMESWVKRSIWTGRSQCLTCREKLRWYELIPVISYIIQKGRCRMCKSIIPSWILGIEVIMGLVWMVFGTLFSIYWYSIWVIGSHLILLSMILILAIEDIKSFTIPDRLSLPMIIITLIIIGLWFYTGWLLPSLKYSFLWGVVGMVFYLLQMIIPGIISLMRKKQYTEILSILMIPIFFPFWIVVKILFGEKKADRWIPSVEKMDHLPTWVGSGDVRLGILLGLILWPVYFWWVVGIGYTLWTLFWLVAQLIGREKLDILPVAPLLFLGFCATWMIQICS